MSFLVLFIRKDLQDSSIEDAENVHHHLEDEHPPSLVCSAFGLGCVLVNKIFEKSTQKEG